MEKLQGSIGNLYEAKKWIFWSVFYPRTFNTAYIAPDPGSHSLRCSSWLASVDLVRACFVP